MCYWADSAGACPLFRNQIVSGKNFDGELFRFAVQQNEFSETTKGSRLQFSFYENVDATPSFFSQATLLNP